MMIQWTGWRFFMCIFFYRFSCVKVGAITINNHFHYCRLPFCSAFPHFLFSLQLSIVGSFWVQIGKFLFVNQMPRLKGEDEKQNGENSWYDTFNIKPLNSQNLSLLRIWPFLKIGTSNYLLICQNINVF